MLRILAVDDEPPALEELVYLLGQNPSVGQVVPAPDAGSALRALDGALRERRPLDAVFLDIRMPGLDGLDLARVLSRFADPLPVVFVSAHDDFAVRAFELRAADYLLKPVRADRLAEAVRRVAERRASRAEAVPEPAAVPDPAPARPVPAPAEPGADDQLIAVQLSGVTRFVRRSEVRHVEAYGDYVRLHLRTGSHLLRVPLSTLEAQWGTAGFVRVHRRHLVATEHIEELLSDDGRMSVRVGGTVLPVSRRSHRRLRELVRSACPPGGRRPGDG